MHIQPPRAGFVGMGRCFSAYSHSLRPNALPVKRTTYKPVSLSVELIMPEFSGYGTQGLASLHGRTSNPSLGVQANQC